MFGQKAKANLAKKEKKKRSTKAQQSATTKYHQKQHNKIQLYHQFTK
jgi:hypothetical protein